MEIALAISTYDDIFSDFDIRGYEDRALSKDFLDELHVRLRKFLKEQDLKILFVIPASRRNIAEETLIIGRLQKFYAERKDHYFHEYRKELGKSVLFVAIGLLLSLAASFLVQHFPSLPLFGDFLLIPSWFFVWSGFEFLIKKAEISRKKKYYATLAASATAFKGIENS